MGFPKYITNKGKMFGCTLIWLLLSYTGTNASEAPCKYQKLNQFDIFCAQTARQEYLEKTWDFLRMVPESKESKSQIKPIRETITKEINKTINQLRNQNRYVAEDEDLLLGDVPDERVDIPLTDRERNQYENRDLFINKPANYPGYVPPAARFFANLNRKPNRTFFYDWNTWWNGNSSRSRFL